jgi:hypothetical protein
MSEATGPAPSVALAAWLAAPADAKRLSALCAASAAAPLACGTIDRLPIEAIPALAQADGLRLSGLRPQVRAALLVAGLGSRLGIVADAGEVRDLDHLPFTLHAQGRDAVVEVSASPERRRAIGQPFYHQWAGGIQAAALVIDCHRIEQVNSVTIAWMLQLVQSVKPVPVRIDRARPQVSTQLRQLRLDHLMHIG